MTRSSLGYLLMPSAFAVIAAAGCSYTAVRPGIDAESGACVKCHSGHREHPVGVVYAESLRLKKTGLVPPDSLNPSVRLVNGMIGCATCHVRYSEDDHKALSLKRKGASVPDPMLVIDNSKSGLCLACHRK